VEISIYILCLCTGGPLNIISFIRSTRLYRSDQRNRSQILLLRIHLNIADLLTMFIYTPTQIIWMTTFQWYGGDILCRICKFFYTFSFYLNSFVIAGIAIDRACSAYRINSLKGFESANRRVRRTLIAAYMGATIFSIPQLFIFRVFQPAEMAEFSFYLNSFVIAGIAIDRACSAYRINSLKGFESANRRVRRTLIAAYMGATIFSIPQLFIFRVFQPAEMAEFRQCTPVWTIFAYEYDLRIQSPRTTEREKHILAASYMQVHRWEKVYNMAHLLLLFWIPSLIIAFSYILIICKLNSLKREKSAPSSQLRALLPPPYKQERRSSLNGNVAIMPNMQTSCGESCLESVVLNTSTSRPRVGPIARQTIHKATKNAKRQAALILVAYLTLWSPYNVMAVMNTFATSSEGREMVLVTLPFLNALIVVNPVVNPLIYGLCQSHAK
uniref:G-protein coupled receptors family 1 profile domain-containing protein n=1 Tax=Ascaris lumbricoides TaxID=6252 RepID=A0A9J2Q9B6_ASCLU